MKHSSIRSRRRGWALSVCLSFIGLPGLAVTPSAVEFGMCREWSEKTFSTSDAATPPAYLELVYQDVADGVTRGRSWRGTPFQLGDKTYAHGLAFNSIKHLLVHVGRPVRRFTADIGLENNDDTVRGEGLGQGSVTFQVRAGGQEIFSSPVMRRKDGAKQLDLDMHGARDFELRVGDGGDGRGWDQALWAEAVVTLEDGTRLRLQDLPLGNASQVNPFAFSFQYNGTNVSELLPRWTAKTESVAWAPEGARQIVSWKDPGTSLEIKLEVSRFGDFPAVEWVAYLSNNGPTNTPIIEDLQGINTSLLIPASGEPALHWAKGAVASFDDFAPATHRFKAGQPFRLSAGEGRSSSQVLPFFNLEGANGGALLALGWSGSWTAEFAVNSHGQFSLRAGQERTHLVLYPGEVIRTPRMLLLFYEGDRWRGQNLLRQFILAHHRPTLAGKPLTAPITCGNWGGTRADVHLDNIQKIAQQQLPLAYYWIDAEWFGQGGWPVNVGNWEVKKDLYPQGFKPLSDALRQSGRELMLWFEPERVYKGTAWYRDRHDFLIDTGGENTLFNLGDPAARKFLTDFISQKIDEFGLGCFRQDFNMDPAPFWKAADPPDRQGVAENKHVQGLYAFWDELLARHPALIIDNCASGGRRIDLETIGRATPFWRTDGPRDAVAHQCHTYGLLPWVPLSATSQDRAGDDYEFRSSMCSGLCLNWWVSGDAPAERIPDNFPYSWARQTLEQYLKYRDCFYGDYYPLTRYSQASDQWMAYQLDQPEPGRGLVVVLRRPDSPYVSGRFGLRGLQLQAQYHFTNIDTGDQTIGSGKELAEAGLEVSLRKHPSSVLFRYERLGAIEQGTKAK